MNQEILPGPTAGNTGLMELGFALGQSHTFGVIAGRCSAAQAQGLRRLREEKLYKRCCKRWEDFCPAYLKMCRAEADRIIQLLDELGPTYFELSQVIRISPVVFRAIAPAVSDGVLHYKGEAIALNAENSRRVAAAVSEMRGALPKKSADLKEPQQNTVRRIEDLSRRCVEILAEFDEISRDENLGAVRTHLRDAITRVRDKMLRVAA
jgi:hypothetical protein